MIKHTIFNLATWAHVYSNIIDNSEKIFQQCVNQRLHMGSLEENLILDKGPNKTSEISL